jgi:hypothetical protein
MSSESWKTWVTEQRQEYSQRVKSAHLTRESESSSLGWPTATVFDTTGGSYPTEMVDGAYRSKHSQDPNSPWYGAKLKDAVETHEKNWATPQTFDSNNLVRTPEKLAQTRAEKNAGCMNLREQVHYPDMDHSRKAAKNWPTASTRDHKGGYTGGRIRNGKVSMDTLDVAVQAHTEGGLLDQASDSTTGKRQESQQWATPRANKVHPHITEENRAHLANRGKSNLEEDIAGHCGTAQGKLNPDWVEHLMGLPAGWTDLGSWATE